ncbi:MAG: phosphoribosyltransferase [Flavobacteriaceae bacterium]|nr:phosphoribosyltransferase [Flavobacteriaceae bacterium]
MAKNCILTADQSALRIRRIAFQIHESNTDVDEIVVAGIMSSGFKLAEEIARVLTEITPIKVVCCQVNINKKTPLESISTSLKASDYRDKSIVLIDDVLNSGKTLAYGIRHFLEVPLKRFKTAVLIDRNHKNYPVKADFKGLSLSTSLHEHVEVIHSDKGFEAYLT